MNTNAAAGAPDRDLTLQVLMIALDKAVAMAAEAQGVSFGELRHQVVYEGTIEATSQIAVIFSDEREKGL